MTVKVKRVNGALRWYDEPEKDYRVEVTCKRCGADTRFVTGGSRWSWHQAMVVECTECQWQGAVTVELVEVAKTQRGRKTA